MAGFGLPNFGQLTEAFKPTMIVVNKWDLVQRKLKPADYQEYLTQEFPGLAFAPIVFTSARSGTGVREAVAKIGRAHV